MTLRILASLTLAGLLATFAAPAPAVAADRACNLLYTDFLMEEERGEERPTYSLDRPLPIEVGSNGLLFLFYRDAGGTHHVLEVRIAEPTSRSDRRLVRVQNQDAKDLGVGRVELTAVERGRVRLPYTITGARGGADVLAEIPERCRSGHLTLDVVAPKVTATPTVPEAERAAHELATRLSVAVLGSRPSASLLDTYAATLRRDGRDGLVAVTADLLASAAFQRRLPEDARKVRIVPDGGARLDDAQRRELLFELYEALLGDGQVSLSDHRANSADFAGCLAGVAGSPAAACRQLAARLVGNPSFTARYGGLMTAVGIPHVQPTTPGSGTPQLADRYRAARSLVELLYGALLRREDRTEVHEAFVDTVAAEGREGLAKVAGEVAASTEFRTQAAARSLAAHPELPAADRARREVVRSTLLGDIYGDLYRLAGLSLEERHQHLSFLGRCLEDGDANACRSLGRALVSNELFRESHGATLARLEAGRR